MAKEEHIPDEIDAKVDRLFAHERFAEVVRPAVNPLYVVKFNGTVISLYKGKESFASEGSARRSLSNYFTWDWNLGFKYAELLGERYEYTKTVEYRQIGTKIKDRLLANGIITIERIR